MNTPDQPTPRTDEAYFANGATMYSLAGEMKLLERELAAAKAECERFRLCTLKQDAELTRLRAQEIDYVKMIAEVLKCEPRSACEQPDNRLEAPWDVIARLRAEVERLRDELAAARQRENVAIASWDEERRRALREGERVVEWRDRAERAEAAETVALARWNGALERAIKAEADLADWSVLKAWGGTPKIVHKFIRGQQHRIHYCQNIEAELATERARLDAGQILLTVAGERVWHCGVDLRAAIDAAMKENAK